MHSLHGLLNCEIGGLDCHDITTEYRTRLYKHVGGAGAGVNIISKCFTPGTFFSKLRNIYK